MPTVNKSSVFRYIASAVGIISAAAVCLSACNKEEAVYLDSSSVSDTTVTEPIPTEPDYSRLFMGSTYSALPLSAMTRVALLGESYSDAELYTASGTKDEVLYAFENGSLDFLLTTESSVIPENSIVTPVARQALVFYVSSDNPIKSLTSEQLKEIYRGKHIAWEELGGSKQPITAVQRGTPNAAQEYLEYFIGDEISDPPRSVATGRNDIFDYSVGDIGCAIYSPELFMYDDNIHLLEIDGVMPTDETINNGTYPLIMNVCAVSRPNDIDAQAVIDWLLSEEGQTIAATSGYLPLSNDYEGYRYSVTLYNSNGTSGEYRSDDTFQYYYTLSDEVIVRSVENEKQFSIEGLKNEELTSAINAFIAESVEQIDSSYEAFEEMLENRSLTGGYSVTTECVNGYLSVMVRLAYNDDGREYTYRYRCRTYNLYTGEPLEFSDLFYQDISFSPELHRITASQAALPYDTWNSVMITKREFTGIPNSFGFTLSHIYFDIDNPFFINGESFSFHELDELMVIYTARDMEGIWEDGLVTRVFRKYTPDGCDPEALYETTVLDGQDTVENLVYYRLAAAKLPQLDNTICDSINNAMYSFFKNEMTPEILTDRIKSISNGGVNGLYYVEQSWIPTFYGNSFVMFSTDGSVEYVNSKFEYNIFTDYTSRIYFSLKTGEPLRPSHIFSEGWDSEAVWRAHNPDGSYVQLEEPLPFEVPIENENDDESSEDDSEVQYLTMLRINDIEMLGDENGEEILLITLKETADVKYDHITIAVPSSYINWN